MTLKLRFLASFVIYTLLILSFFGGTYYVLEKRSAIQVQSEDQRKTTEKVVSVCREAYLASSVIAALNYIGVVKREPSIVFAACLNLRGLVQAHSDPQWIGRFIKDPAGLSALQARAVEMRLYMEKGGITVSEWNAPVRVNGITVGFARVGYDQDFMEREIARKLWLVLRQLMLVSSATFLVAIFISLALAWSLSRPIARLAEAAREIGEGNFQAKVLSLGRDEMAELAQCFNQMAKKLAALDELKNSLISTVSHDLRNPLASITMYSNYLLQEERGNLNEKQKRMLQIIKESSRRLGVFVNNLLDHAKIKAGMMKLYLKPCRLEDIVRSVCQLLQATAQLGNIDLKFFLPEELPAVLVDEERLDQVFMNLISNAFKFTPDGGKIWITARNEETGVQVSVSDTGKGIPAESLGRIFEQFEQIDVAGQRIMKIKGTGLGLSIVRQAIEAHSGRIWVESEVGKGTTFHFILPRAEEARNRESHA